MPHVRRFNSIGGTVGSGEEGLRIDAGDFGGREARERGRGSEGRCWEMRNDFSFGEMDSGCKQANSGGGKLSTG